MTDTEVNEKYRGCCVFDPLDDETEALIAEALQRTTGMPEAQTQCNCASLYIEHNGSFGDDDNDGPLGGKEDRYTVLVSRSHHKGCGVREDNRRRKLEHEMHRLMERFTRGELLAMIDIIDVNPGTDPTKIGWATTTSEGAPEQ